MKISSLAFVLLLSFIQHTAFAGNEVSPNIVNAQAKNNLIVNGVPWFDTDGNIINAHGACIVEDGGRYWLFGEYKSDDSNAFPGFGCYSSTDLVNWKFERVVLPVQPDGILGPDRVGERVKVMRCPSTGEYVMLMHADDLKYKDPHIGIAVCDKINGDYKLLGTIEYNGTPIRKWDMGTFQDEDGAGYILIHHGPIYRLSDDYRSIVEMCADVKGAGESPAMMKKDGIYYLLTSNLTSWERNDNFYFTSTDIHGPWTKQGLFCPEGTLTYNSQCTFVFPMKKDGKTTHIYMGDRWSYPNQASAATYVWLPMQTDGTNLSIPEYWESWNADKVAKTEFPGKVKKIDWVSDKKEKPLHIPFHGERITIYGVSDNMSGYAIIRITDSNGKEYHNSLVDFYSKVNTDSPKFRSLLMPKGDYTLEIIPAKTMPVWYKKNGERFGSNGTNVKVTKLIIE